MWGSVVVENGNSVGVFGVLGCWVLWVFWSGGCGGGVVVLEIDFGSWWWLILGHGLGGCGLKRGRRDRDRDEERKNNK